METPRLKTDINNNPPLTLPGNQQKSEPKLQTAEQHQETYENVKKSQLKISKSRARKLSSDHESDIDPNSPVNKPNPNANTNTNPQPKTQVAEPPKQKTGIPVEPKDPYRVGQVVDEKSTPVKTQPKAPVSDTEPQRNPVPARKLNLENVQTKEKPKVDESGLHSSRSEKDLKLNLSAVAQKNKNPQWPLDSGSRGTFEAYEKLMEAKGVPKNAAEIEAENKQLRQFLKDLNDQLQQHLEKVKVVEYEKKVEFKNKSPEEQIRTIIRELANNEKILAYNKEEYRKSEVRLNMIKDPKYVMSIQQEITKAQISIDAIKKENKRMELKNGSAGKDLDVIENVKGMPGSLEETHLREKEAAKFEHKLLLLKQKNESLNAERKQKLEKEKAVSEQIKKLERKYFGDSYVSEQDMQKYNKLHKNLDAAEEDLKMAKNKCKFKATQIARDMEELYMVNQKEREHIDRLEDVLQEQAKALKELLSTEGSRMSKTGQDVLEQIKASLENEERRKMSSPSNAEESRLRDKERSATLLKTKSISGIKQLDAIHYDLQSPVAGGNSKHKNAIKRELEEKKSSWKETGPAGRPKLEELGNVKRNNNVPRNSEDFDGDTNAKKKPEQNEKKKVVKEQEEMIKDVEDEEKEKKKKKEKETKKEEFIQESPREMKIQASKDKTEDAVKEVPVKQQEVKKEQEAKKEQKEKEKKVATQGEEDANKLKEEIKNYSKQIEQEVTQKKGENTKRKEEQPANQQVIPKQNVNTEVPRKENKEENHDATQKQETKREEHGDNNVVPIKKSQLKVIKSRAHRLADDAESDVDIVDGNGAAHNKQEVKKKENTDLQLDLTKSKPKQNEESPLKSNAEGESKRKEVKEVDTKRPKQQESPQKSERGTHNEEAREWDDNNDFGVEQRKKINKPKEVKKEVKKAADEFEEYEFDS